MISGDEAQRRLEGFRTPARGSLRAATDRALLSSHGRRASQWLHEWSHDGDADEVGRTLDAMSDRERLRVLRVAAPALADSLAAWWPVAVHQPYQHGWMRRGFRSTDPADSAAGRALALRGITLLAATYDQPVEWWARWSTHASYGQLAPLLAAEVDRGNTEVRQVLLDAVAGRDEVARMSHDVVGALTQSADPEGWQQLDHLLRTAGRQEGLRQSILEATDLAHPGARRLFVRTVVEEGYTRFAAAIRAVGTWWGEGFEVRQDRQVRDHLAVWLPMLEGTPPDPADLEAPEAFLALEALALDDARAAVAAAARLLGHDSAEHRLAAARILHEVALPAGWRAVVPAIDDPDLRVAAVALEAVTAETHGAHASLTPAAVEAAMARLPALPARTRTLATGLLGARETKIGRAHVADALLQAAGPEVAPLVEAANEVASAQGRATLLRRWAQDPTRHRAALMGALTDLSSWNRGEALRALQGVERITEEEALPLEDALRRKAADQRTTALSFLTRQEPAAVAASIERLRGGDAQQRRAADELAAATGAATAEQPAPAVPPVLLVRATERTPPQRPVAPGFAAAYPQVAPNAQHLLDSLAEHLDRHQRTEVLVHHEPQPLGSLTWLPATADGTLPAAEVLEEWWAVTSAGLTDGGLEALLLTDFRPDDDHAWARERARRVLGRLRWPRAYRQRHSLAGNVLAALARHSLRESWAEPYLLAVREVAVDVDAGWLQRPLAVHEQRRERVQRAQWGGGRGDADARDAVEALGVSRWQELEVHGLLPERLVPEVWGLLRWLDEPEGSFDPVDGAYVASDGYEPGHFAYGADLVPAAPFRRPTADRVLLRAWAAGAATRGDVLDAVVSGNGRLLEEGTRRRPPAWVAEHDLGGLFDEVRSALLAAETVRGDLPTPTTRLARRISSVPGVAALRDLLLALGKRPFARGYDWGTGRDSTLSYLVRASWPAPADDDVTIDAALGDLPPKRLVELAVYAPQWAGHVERVLGWPGLESGVWWLHAHTKDDSWAVAQEIREEWAAAVSRHTPLEADDLVRGATDVAWFGDVLGELGEERFETLLAASKYASSSGGHKRAELFSRALRGLVGEDELRTRIDDKRHQDSVRAIGLLPVEPDDGEVVLRRYEYLRAWVATDRSSGSQRRASEQLAVEVGLDNLARSAGYRDPQRLVWAMEAHAVADLADGALSAADGDLVVTLSLDEAGRPALAVRRGDRELKSVPAASARRAPEIAALKARVTALRKQAARMRASLEQACVGGESFTADEYAELFSHPMLAPLLRDLVVVSSEGVIGFADDAGHVLSPDGDRVPLDASPVRVAHPLDLLASGSWPDFQHRLFAARRTQPFKQVFRELYTLTEAERSAVDRSRRYAGHQVQSRQAAGLFRARGWVTDFEVGFVRTFHAERLTVFCSLLDGWGSPTEVEDATIGDVWFVGRDGPVPLTEVPPRLFSEVMRDLDLVVSVAHSGGVDPETSESSVEVRRRLVEETARMLSLGNVEVDGRHAFVEGTLGSYSVQLGSGTVHRLPGGAVCIVPVSAQHRGRVFLPFADDDPRTAEVVSKVVLLARDDRIKDPTILAQLR